MCALIPSGGRQGERKFGSANRSSETCSHAVDTVAEMISLLCWMIRVAADWRPVTDEAQPK